jgi:hypothetical protein
MDTFKKNRTGIGFDPWARGGEIQNEGMAVSS